MKTNTVSRRFNVEIYYNDGTSKKYFNVEWLGGNSEAIILSKDKKTWYFMKVHIKYIMREEAQSHSDDERRQLT